MLCLATPSIYSMWQCTVLWTSGTARTIFYGGYVLSLNMVPYVLQIDEYSDRWIVKAHMAGRGSWSTILWSIVEVIHQSSAGYYCCGSTRVKVVYIQGCSCVWTLSSWHQAGWSWGTAIQAPTKESCPKKDCLWLKIVHLLVLAQFCLSSTAVQSIAKCE
jgi:hypothetical protein